MGNIIGGPGAAIGGTSVPVINAGPAVVGIPRPLSPGLNYGERWGMIAIEDFMFSVVKDQISYTIKILMFCYIASI